MFLLIASIKSADPWACPRGVRRVGQSVPLSPSLFPPPGPQKLGFWSPGELRPSSPRAPPVDLAPLFWSSRSMFVFTCLLKSSRNRFQTDFGPILAPFLGPKSVPKGSSHRHANEIWNITLKKSDFPTFWTYFCHPRYPISIKKQLVFIYFSRIRSCPMSC